LFSFSQLKGMSRKFKFNRENLQGVEYVGDAVVRCYEDGIEVVRKGWVVAEYANRSRTLRLLACNRVVVEFDVFANYAVIEEIASKADINEVYDYLLSIGAKEIN
ncbi:MAG: hypothetical protein QXQ68_08595, partial [Candidatus Nitrosocaldaceae archaeon]